MTANLLSRLQGLTAPDREVSTAINRWLHVKEWTEAGRSVPTGFAESTISFGPDVTASLDAAVALCERVLPGWDGFAPINATGEAWVWPAGGMSRGHRANGPTPAIALLIAILTALEARDAE